MNTDLHRWHHATRLRLASAFAKHIRKLWRDKMADKLWNADPPSLGASAFTWLRRDETARQANHAKGMNRTYGTDVQKGRKNWQ